jgi:hypothetical protein
MAANPMGSRNPQCFLSYSPGWSWQCRLVSNPARRHSCHLGTSSGPRGLHAAAKVLIKVGADSFTDANKNDGTFLAVAAQCPQDHLL